MKGATVGCLLSISLVIGIPLFIHLLLLHPYRLMFGVCIGLAISFYLHHREAIHHPYEFLKRMD